MTASSTVAQPRQFTIGRVLGTSFSLLWRNILPFGIVATIVAIPYIFVALAWQTDSAPHIANAQSLRILYSRNLSKIAATTATSLATSAAFAYGTFQNLRGQRTGLLPSLNQCLSRPVILLLGILAFTVLYCIGFVLLILPSLLIVTVFWLYMPVIVLEKTGVVAGFKRSRELTKGQRWPIFGLLLLVGLTAALSGFAEGAIFKHALSHQTGQYIAIGLQIPYNTFSAVMVTVGYYYLRADKEGLAIGDIGDIFG